MADLTWALIREFFDGCGSTTHGAVNITNAEPECYIYSADERVLKEIAKFAGIPCNQDFSINRGYCLTYSGCNCIDFLGNVYKGKKYTTGNYTKYCRILSGRNTIPKCLVFKDDDRAVIPSKAKDSDAGYDLTIIKEHKRLNDTTIMYDTGIKVKLDTGYYGEVVPRSSLSKTGYMLANSIGIIDQNYRGNIYIALTKVDPNSPDIMLPNRCCQLIVRRQFYVEMQESCEDFDETTRGGGGFGSTGV